MKYIKASTCSLVTLSLLSYVNSAERVYPDLWGELRSTLKQLPIPQTNPGQTILSATERETKIDEGFSLIERDLERLFPGSAFMIPDSLKELHKRAGNLAFTQSVVLPTPIGGTDSYLYKRIKAAYQRNLPHEWLPFGEMDGNEYFCIHYSTGKVSRFTLNPAVKEHDTYINIEDWARKNFLSH